MKPWRILFITTALVLGTFITAVDAAKLRFVKPNAIAREVQEIQKTHVLTLPDYVPSRNLGLSKGTKVRIDGVPPVKY
jgi:hypothetical protein